MPPLSGRPTVPRARAFTALLIGLGVVVLAAGCASRRASSAAAEPYTGTRLAPTETAQTSYVRARRLAGLGRFAEAARVLERVTDDAPHFIPAHRLYQDLLVESAADWRVRTRYAALLAENPEDADAHYLAARIEPDRERQAELFEAASELDPMHPWARVGNALVDLRAGDLEEAAGSAYLSSVLAPSLALPWEFLGQMGLSRGDPGAALEWFDEAIARDPRSVRAHLGRASAARDNGDRAGAAVAALSALRLGPGDGRVIAAVTEELAGSAPPSVVRDALDVTTAALGDVAERWPVSLLRARLRLALGDAAGAHAEARSALRTGAGHADVARVSRRASIRVERYAAAVSEFLEGAPAELLRSDNLYGGRWRDLAAVARVAQRRDDSATLLRLGDALLAVGWRAEARVVLARASAATDRAASDDAARRAGRRLTAATAFDHFITDVGRLGRALRRASRRGESRADVAAVLRAIGAASRQRLGYDVTEGALVRSYPFLGEFASSVTSEGVFAREFDERGLLLLVGHRRGEGPRIAVGRIQLVRADATAKVRGEELTFDECWIETAGLPPELAGLGGGLAGLTIDRFVILQLDAVLRGAALPPAGLAVVPRPAPTREDRLALDTPSSVSRRIEAQLAAEGRLSGDLLAAVRTHELGHVLDAREMLPVLSPPWRGLWLVLRHGFDGAAVEATLEARAAVIALAESRAPRAALASLLAFLPDTDGSTAHVRGYLGAARRAVEIVDRDPVAFPSIDRRFNILQQLDRLGDDEARELGRRLLVFY